MADRRSHRGSPLGAAARRTAVATAAADERAQHQRLGAEACGREGEAGDRHGDQLDDLGHVQPLPVEPTLQERAGHRSEACDQEDRRTQLSQFARVRTEDRFRHDRGEKKTSAARPEPLAIERRTAEPTCSRVQDRLWTRNAPKPS